uniref:RRM domain-containing protein n=1 Tax=Globodera pallida TaxID=36090 RepID=A0A183CMS8_GLOPA
MKTRRKAKLRPDGVKECTANGTTDLKTVGNCSRLIVKNLPCGKKTRWDEAKVRTQFSKFGTLTDVRLKLNEKTGACKFAFVGFATAESCQMAIKAMDGTARSLAAPN